MTRTKCLRCTCFHFSAARQVNSARLDLSVPSAAASTSFCGLLPCAGLGVMISVLSALHRFLVTGGCFLFEVFRQYGVKCSHVEYAWICL